MEASQVDSNPLLYGQCCISDIKTWQVIIRNAVSSYPNNIYDIWQLLIFWFSLDSPYLQRIYEVELSLYVAVGPHPVIGSEFARPPKLETAYYYNLTHCRWKVVEIRGSRPVLYGPRTCNAGTSITCFIWRLFPRGFALGSVCISVHN